MRYKSEVLDKHFASYTERTSYRLHGRGGASEGSPLSSPSLVVPTRLTQTFSVDYGLLSKFGEWLSKTKNAMIILKKKDVACWGFGIDEIMVLPYETRFKESYVRKTLYKFKLISRKYRDKPYVHLVLTCRHDVSIPKSIELLKFGWNKLRTTLVKKHGLLPYICVLEPHKSGYPHLHVLIFTSKYLVNQAQLSNLWQKYGVGKVVYLKRYWNWGRDSRGFKYLTKYLTKFYKDVPKVLKMLNGQTSDFKGLFMKRVTFYAWLWHGKVKTYSFSQGFSSLWFRKSSGEWEFWMICWDEGLLDSLIWFYGIRFDHQIDDFFPSVPNC